MIIDWVKMERETMRTRTITIIIEQMAAMTMLTAMVTQLSTQQSNREIGGRDEMIMTITTEKDTTIKYTKRQREMATEENQIKKAFK